MCNPNHIILERSQIVELYLVQEIQQVEQLLQIVLQRRSRQEQLVADVVSGQEPEELTLIDLQTVSFIDDQHCPVDRSQARGINRHQFVTGEQNVELDGFGSNP